MSVNYDTGIVLDLLKVYDSLVGAFWQNYWDNRTYCPDLTFKLAVENMLYTFTMWRLENEDTQEYEMLQSISVSNVNWEYVMSAVHICKDGDV